MIIFDFDGTIADSFDYVLQFLVSQAGITEQFTEAEHLRYRGLSMKDMALQLGIPLWRLPLLYFKGRRAMREHLLDLKPFAGLPEVITSLHNEHQHTLAIVSANSAKNIRQFLRHHEMENCFDIIRGSTGVFGKVKPIKQMLKNSKIAKENCWYVGDEVQDMLNAKAAGVKSLAVTWGFATPAKLALFEPTAIAKRPADILRIIKKSLILA